MSEATLGERFEERCGRKAAEIFRAPARVNLIGEHTDYNDGFVMPAAIGFSTCVAVSPRDDRQVHVTSENLDDSATFELDGLESDGVAHWSKYVAGVAWALESGARVRLRGADLLISSDVPIGAGLSSSAALEVASAFALLSCVQVTLDRTVIAQCCQQAENEFVGMRCGIMDPFISCHGGALMLDCRTLDATPLKLPPGVAIVICNSMVKHSLVGGTNAYNARRADCEEGARLLDVAALRDVALDTLEAASDTLPPRVYRRCRHVVTENERVRQAAAALERGDLAAFGQALNASHDSLREDYEVSCYELDFLVEEARKCPGVYGARMTGAGFGGCTVNMVATDAVDDFRRVMRDTYEEECGRAPDIYVCAPAEGAGRLDESSL